MLAVKDRVKQGIQIAILHLLRSQLVLLFLPPLPSRAQAMKELRRAKLHMDMEGNMVNQVYAGMMTSI
jgi:hypothetical protein